MLDTHCHIDLYPNPELILNECDRNCFPILSMTNLPSHFEKGFPFFQNRNRVRQALGMHPLYAKHHKSEFPKFINNLDKTSYIGEIGLDFSKEGINSRAIQLETFEKILTIISNQNKLLSIHSRDAERQVLDLLKKYNIKNVILHWYSGSVNLIEEIIQQGYYFSINPVMTRSIAGKNIISKIPINLILTETDGPFICEDNFPIKPGQVQEVTKFLAHEHGINEEEVKSIIVLNFNKLLSQLKNL